MRSTATRIGSWALEWTCRCRSPITFGGGGRAATTAAATATTTNNSSRRGYLGVAPVEQYRDGQDRRELADAADRQRDHPSRGRQLPGTSADAGQVEFESREEHEVRQPHLLEGDDNAVGVGDAEHSWSDDP